MQKLNIGITGQQGFIGQYLYNMVGLYPDQFKRIEFERIFFDRTELLEAFVAQCDVIVHLAAVNRHNEPDFIYSANRELAFKLVDALTKTGSRAHVIFSSSTQEERDNVYGKSKKEAREALASWAKATGNNFTGLVIPNVFGPFGHPDYNSVVATFCHRLARNESPKIDVDGNLKIIYVGELVKIILDVIKDSVNEELLQVDSTQEIKVSAILALLEGYKDQYLERGIIPGLQNNFELNLFNTFRCYIDIKNHYPVKYTRHVDQRGAFVEVIRLNVGGQISFSTTVPGVTRGNHFHTRKIERFSVIKGNARIQMRRIGTQETIDFYLNGNEPAYVDMPVWYTHNITNIGEEDLYTIFWINEFYNATDPDTFFENV